MASKRMLTGVRGAGASAALMDAYELSEAIVANLPVAGTRGELLSAFARRAVSHALSKQMRLSSAH